MLPVYITENLEATIKVDGRNPLSSYLGEERARALLPMLSRYARSSIYSSPSNREPAPFRP